MDRYELVPDSGGAGKFRGGLGIRRDWRMLSDGVLCNLRTDGFKFPAVGNFGAKPARPSRFFSNRGTEREKSLTSKLRNYPLDHDDTISWETGGGGGWGNPLDRDPEMVLADVLDGYVTIDAARDDYGIVVDLEGKRVDVEKTAKLRAALAK
jgi:N-methylhydantoinase B